ncbi:MAG: hypothetical protein MUC86_08840, partial [Burkholderiaceae bacterium]|nr:hypothetical protein [Burkholderiaceae bacterium]
KTARHESGLSVTFSRSADDAPWHGQADPGAAQSVRLALTQHHGPHNAHQRLARLMREALAAWTYAVTHTARAANR